MVGGLQLAAAAVDRERGLLGTKEMMNNGVMKNEVKAPLACCPVFIHVAKAK
jgi:hypothetical protein